MNGESIDIKQTRLEKLKGLFPELFAESQLDWEKLKAAFGEDINFANERYVLNWAGKSDAFKILQQPTTATLKPAPEESVNLDTTENLFIEGENLEALKVLQKAYYGKVKCIIIDPPYNTGSDSFIYPDRFSEKKEDYLKRIGDKDEEGYLLKEGMFRKNSKDSGHYHSNWLSMMYPRLFLAKNLLRDDGVIFVHIDDNEVHNLRMVMNEIYGEENFVMAMIWQRRQNADNRNENFASTDHEYVLVYSKNSSFSLKGKEIDKTKYKNPDNDPRGPWASIDLSGLATKDQRPNLHYDIIDPKTGISYPPNPTRGWSKSRDTIQKMIENNEVLFPSNPNGRPRQKKFLKDIESTRTGLSSILKREEVGFTTNGTQEFTEIFDGRFFAYPKPVDLIKKLIGQSTNGEEIILDFFGGSGTTAQAVLELNKEDGVNRKFILVQLPEPCDENSEAYKAGCKTIADIAKERIRRVIQRIAKSPLTLFQRGEQENMTFQRGETIFPTLAKGGEGGFDDKKLDLGFKVFKLSSSNFKIWKGSEIDNEEKLMQQLDAFTDPIRPGAEKQNMLYELMLKAGYELTSLVQYVSLNGVKKAAGTGYYSINDNELIIALDAMNEKLVEQIIAAKPQKVITLDSLFAGNDQLKTNTVLQMRDAGIDFKTI